VALFLSTFINRIDAKGRVSVPAPFRAALAGQSFNGIVVFPATKLAAIEGSGIDRIASLAARIDSLPEFSDERNAISAIFADAQQLPFDSEGRVMFPGWLLELANITDNASFVGIGSTFQIWEPEAFRAHHAEMRSRARTITLPSQPAGNGGAA